MSESLYFSDIDPNQSNYVISARQLRRKLMSRLLIWDSIVVSDSQMLQDPRFRLMMSPTVLQELTLFRRQDDSAFDDLEEWQGGFEALLRSGLVEVACRERDLVTNSLPDTWLEMSKSQTRVPFLTHSRGYADYIEKTGYKQRSFSLSGVASRFRKNLLKGLDLGAVPLDKHNPVYHEFVRMISADVVQLRVILKFLNDSCESGYLTEDEKNHLYQFCSSCYSINVPAETKCYLSARLSDLPRFLCSGTYDGVDGTSIVNQIKLRKSWAIDPAALDLMPLEAFVEVRNELSAELSTGLLLKAQEGNLQNDEEAKRYYDVWDSYVSKLESAMERSLCVTRDQLNDITRKNYMPAQAHLENAVSEIVINNVLSKLPVVRDVVSVLDFRKKLIELRESLIIFNQKQAQAYFADYHDDIQQYLDHLRRINGSIVTKYQ